MRTGCGRILNLHGFLPVRSAVAGVLGTRGGLLGDWIAWKSLTLLLVDWSADNVLLDVPAALQAYSLLSTVRLWATCSLDPLPFAGCCILLCSQTLFCCIPRCRGLILRLQSSCALDVLAFLFALVRQWPARVWHSQ